MESTRLPGKSLMEIEGRTLFEHVIDRVKSSERLDSIVVAMPDTSANAVIAKLCEKIGVDYFRGSHEDVLDRYARTAEKFNADLIVRITADNPLTDPLHLDKLVDFHVQNNADYCYVVGLPVGVGVSAVARKALIDCDRLGKEPHHREHVTKYLVEHRDKYRVLGMEVEEFYRHPEWKLTVDTVEDLERMRRIFRIAGYGVASNGDNYTFELKKIIQIILSDKSILKELSS